MNKKKLGNICCFDIGAMSHKILVLVLIQMTRRNYMKLKTGFRGINKAITNDIVLTRKGGRCYLVKC